MSKGIYIRGSTYWVRFKYKSVEYRESLRVAVDGPKSQQLAETEAEKLRKKIISDVKRAAGGLVSWKKTVVDWHQHVVNSGLRPSTIKRYLTSLRQLKSHLDDALIEEIDVPLVRKLIAGRTKAGACNATIKRDLTALTHVLDFADTQGWLPDSGNPIQQMNLKKMLKERRDPICLPIPEEVEAVLSECSPTMRDIGEFADQTGLRVSEVSQLKHMQIDRERKCVTIYKAKGRRPRAVPLNRKAMTLLDRQPRHITGSYVFWHGDGKPYTNVSTNFCKIRNRVAQKWAQAGRPFQGFRFHDLRHQFAVRFLKDRRGSIYDLQQILGHKSIRTTELYLDYLTPDEQAAARRGVAQSSGT